MNFIKQYLNYFCNLNHCTWICLSMRDAIALDILFEDIRNIFFLKLWTFLSHEQIFSRLHNFQPRGQRTIVSGCFPSRDMSSTCLGTCLPRFNSTHLYSYWQVQASLPAGVILILLFCQFLQTRIPAELQIISRLPWQDCCLVTHSFVRYKILKRVIRCKSIHWV